MFQSFSLNNKIIIRVFFLSAIALVLYTGLCSYQTGAPDGFCGAPSTNGFTCQKTCHSGPLPPTLNGLITSNIPPSGYIPGNTYVITASIIRSGHTTFGFEISPQDSAGTFLGTLVNNSTETQLVGSTNNYVTHTLSGTNGADNKSWSFDWLAPSQGAGNLTFYGAFLAANGNGMDSGDSLFLSTFSVNENTNGIAENPLDIFDVSIFPNPVSATLNISYSILEKKNVEIKLFDIFGNYCEEIGKEIQAPGKHQIQYKFGSNLAYGVYMIKFDDGSNVSIKKLIYK